MQFKFTSNNTQRIDVPILPHCSSPYDKIPNVGEAADCTVNASSTRQQHGGIGQQHVRMFTNQRVLTHLPASSPTLPIENLIQHVASYHLPLTQTLVGSTSAQLTSSSCYLAALQVCVDVAGVVVYCGAGALRGCATCGADAHKLTTRRRGCVSVPRSQNKSTSPDPALARNVLWTPSEPERLILISFDEMRLFLLTQGLFLYTLPLMPSLYLTPGELSPDTFPTGRNLQFDELSPALLRLSPGPAVSGLADSLLLGEEEHLTAPQFGTEEQARAPGYMLSEDVRAPTRRQPHSPYRLFTPMRVIEVNMERRRNEEVRETGEPREKPTNGIVRHYSHMRKSGGPPAGHRGPTCRGVLINLVQVKWAWLPRDKPAVVCDGCGLSRGVVARRPTSAPGSGCKVAALLSRRWRRGGVNLGGRDHRVVVTLVQPASELQQNQDVWKRCKQCFQQVGGRNGFLADGGPAGGRKTARGGAGAYGCVNLVTKPRIDYSRTFLMGTCAASRPAIATIGGDRLPSIISLPRSSFRLLAAPWITTWYRLFKLSMKQDIFTNQEKAQCVQTPMRRCSVLLKNDIWAILKQVTANNCNVSRITGDVMCHQRKIMIQ
ncbi:hypothetical protein PR048_004669 [Dryococelus australis]|uniref:Uncharacterized protein n=1 Tax=Dryococelus australis TaxID=614101 RepID=A0ABQ9I611_9NEOP|nr:hypothetical protein PR048_004669 [Dryococelus australis]